jgi:hypothetical protein
MHALSTNLESIRLGKTGELLRLTSQEIENELAYQRYRAAEQIIRARVGLDDQFRQDQVDALIDRWSDGDDLRALVDEFLRLAALRDAEILAALDGHSGGRPLRMSENCVA